MNTKGFTLLELLVVAMIIGILVSIGLPFYMRAVERSRSTEAKAFLDNIEKDVQRQYLERGNLYGFYYSPSYFGHMKVNTSLFSVSASGGAYTMTGNISRQSVPSKIRYSVTFGFDADRDGNPFYKSCYGQGCKIVFDQCRDNPSEFCKM
jgi:prepilin-type N-terminal cleavage/methylation domain-containing protein